MILCCGEALVDMIPERTVSGKMAFVPHSGGAVFNTAVALGRLGVPVAMLTGLSRDMFGQQLRTSLDASNVDASLVIESERPTTLAFVEISNGQASYHFVDENSAGRMLSLADMPPIPPHISALYFGGISLACEPAADAYAALLERDGEGRAVMLDPNIRPGFIQNEDRYRRRLARMIAMADIIKVSDEDLDWIDPASVRTGEKAAKLLKMGPTLIVVTHGGDGAIGFLRGGGTVEVKAEPVDIVDTVGAGDTFNAGLLAKIGLMNLLNKNGMASLDVAAVDQALCFGARVAAVTVSRAGANPPWLDELDSV